MKNEIELRDYFAAKVLSGIYANNELYESMHTYLHETNKKYVNLEDYIAQECYKMADAMLKARSEQLICSGCGRTESQHNGQGTDICPNNDGRLKQNNMDNFDKLVIALKDIVIEWKGNKAEDIANEIKNRIDCYCSSDRESLKEERSGVKDNIFAIQDVLNAL